MFKKFVIPIFTLLLVGCNLHDDLSDCGIIRLNFRFTHNSEHTDKFKDNVRDVKFYIFDDATGVLVEIIEATPSDIARGYAEVKDLPAGKYTFVAWGGGSEEMTRGGFVEAHMSDAATHDYTEFVTKGQTELDQFYMMISHDRLPDEVLGDVAPKTDGFEDIFHDAVEGVEVKNLTNQTVDFDFIRNTNIIKVTVTGLEYLANYNPTRAASPDQPLWVYAIGKNGRYRWDNTIDQYARTVRYEPPYTELDATRMQVDIKTLRLDLSRHTAIDPIKLYVINPDTGNNMIYPLDVMDAIGQVKDDNGNFLYVTQEDFDREYEFPIEISILHDLSVKISIDGWEIVNLTPNTDRP